MAQPSGSRLAASGGEMPAAMANYGSSDSEEEEDEAVAERDRLREERRRERREERRRARLTGQRVDPQKVGIDPEAWDEIHDIFGNGEDYAWALAAEEEEEEEKKGKMEYKDVRMTGVY